MPNTIKNIIFDYGNVIFDIDFQKAQDSFINLGVSNIHDIYGHKNQNSIFDDFDKGIISAEEFRNEIRRLTGHEELLDQQIDDAWNSLLLGIPAGNHELLLQIKDQYNTFLLSNNNEIHYSWIMDYLKRDFNLEDNSSFFIKDYYSHLMGMRKPDKEIFEAVLDNHQLNPAETLFIDDSPQHLKTAQELGFKTYLMTKPDTLQHYFATNGLLSTKTNI